MAAFEALLLGDGGGRAQRNAAGAAAAPAALEAPPGKAGRKGGRKGRKGRRGGRSGEDDGPQAPYLSLPRLIDLARDTPALLVDCVRCVELQARGRGEGKACHVL
jgi:hypothetical protein